MDNLFKLEHIQKSFDDLLVIKDITMEIPRNRITAILGPSGCGKTTLLNIMSGLLNKDSGEIIGLNQDSISYMFQESRLMEWKTVYSNIEFVLKEIMPQEKRSKIIDDVLKKVGLIEFKKYYPNSLSGGMKQRVSLARAFAYPSDLLLMDEPFKSLDLELKFSLINRFYDMWQQDKRTVIFITHDVQTAIMLADTIHILHTIPTSIKARIENTVPKEKRTHDNEEFLKMEAIIYKNLLN